MCKCNGTYTYCICNLLHHLGKCTLTIREIARSRQFWHLKPARHRLKSEAKILYKYKTISLSLIIILLVEIGPSFWSENFIRHVGYFWDGNKKNIELVAVTDTSVLNGKKLPAGHIFFILFTFFLINKLIPNVWNNTLSQVLPALNRALLTILLG